MVEPVLKYATHAGGRIVVMTLNRPDALNALSTELFDALNAGWMRFRDDENAWVAILTGAGRAFCSGVDLKEAAAIDAMGGHGVQSLADKIWTPLNEKLALWKPTICAINGYALAAGFAVAMQCDIRLAADTAEIGIPETRWNLSADWAHDLTRQIGLAHALELAIWGDKRINAQRAYEMGWVNKVVPGDQLMAEAMDWANRVIQLGPRSVRILKETIYRGSYLPPVEAHAYAAYLARDLNGMEDTVEGPKAFTEHRAPVFKNK